MEGFDFPLRVVAVPHWSRRPPFAVGHRPLGHEGPDILGALGMVVMDCCIWPSPLGAVQLVPSSATQRHGGKARTRTRGCACSATYTTHAGYGGWSELNVPTPYSRSVALGFPLLNEGQPARG